MTGQTKYRLGEQLLKLYGQTVTGGKVTITQAMLAVSQAANKYIRDTIYRLKSEGEEIVPYTFIRVYESQTEKKGNSIIAKLPIRTLDTLYNNFGIFQVTVCEEPIIPLTQGFKVMYRGLESYGLEGMSGYIPRRDEIEFVGSITEGEKVELSLIPDCTMMQPDENIPLASDGEVEVLSIALQLLQPQMQIQQNIVNDNTER